MLNILNSVICIFLTYNKSQGCFKEIFGCITTKNINDYTLVNSDLFMWDIVYITNDGKSSS